MPRRRVNQSQSKKKKDDDLVPYTKEAPKKRTSLPPEYDAIRDLPAFEPLQLDPIINPGPKLPTDIDFDDPLAFFRLLFTDEIIQHLVDCTNCHYRKPQRQTGRQTERQTERQRERERERQRHLSETSVLVTKTDIETYLGSLIWIDLHPERLEKWY
jgi:hypothetical protein